MPNLTLSIEQDLLDRAKDTARREQVSLNRLVRDVLSERLDGGGADHLSLEDWFAVADRCVVAVRAAPDGGRGWMRGDLYAPHRT